MKKALMTLALFVTLTSNCMAFPTVVESVFSEGSLSKLVWVYSNDSISYYIPNDAIIFNLYQTKYPINGNLAIPIYMVIRDKDLLDSSTKQLQTMINNGTVMVFRSASSEYLSCIVDFISFDKQSNIVIINKEIFYGNRGGRMAVRILDNPEVHNLSDMPNFSKVIQGVCDRLEMERNRQ